MELMNGGNTNTPEDPDAIDQITTTYTANNGADEGRHESEEYYYLCEQRSQQYGMPSVYYILLTLYLEWSVYSLV